MSKGYTFSREMKTTADSREHRYNELAWPNPVSQAVNIESSVEGFRASIDLLPPELIVCSLSLDVDRSHLYVCRYQRGREPDVLRLGLLRDEDFQLPFEEAKEEFDSIIRESDDTMKNADKFRDKKSDWWKKRRALDKRLGALLGRIENCWFGGFKVYSVINLLK